MSKKQEPSWPPLYKRTVEGKILLWRVYVIEHMREVFVEVVYGENGSAKFQRKVTQIKTGKNIGKKNETTTLEQAIADAQGKFDKKLKQGFVRTTKDAEAGKVDKVIKGGMLPMLAHSYDDYKDKVVFPCYVQPKLDGERCVAMKVKGTVTLWTRSRKQITSCPHIVKELQQMLLHVADDVTLDGELYNHDMRDQFEELMKAVRKREPTEASKKVKLYIYDVVHPEHIGPLTYEARLGWLSYELPDWAESVKFVATCKVKGHSTIETLHDTFVKEGYEGLMVRSADGLYENKRSKHLLKFKKFKDAEFPIVGVIKGEDNTVVFVCMNDKSKSFKVTMSGDKTKNQAYLKNHKLWNGKKLTVKYQDLTGKNGVPRFPVGLRIREDL